MSTATFSGTLYSSGTITTSSNSGWLKWPPGEVTAGFLRLVPSGLATDETLDLDLNVAFDDDGGGDIKIHDFTQVTSTNVAENLVLPGGESTALLTVANESVGTPLPQFYKLTWTVAGTTPSMSFILYGAVT